MTPIQESLRTHFGFSAFRPGQAEAIQSLLSGHHTLAVMPTGMGKSLIFQLTALLLGADSGTASTTLVISPLIALMKDQVDSLIRRNIPATYINSALPAAEQTSRLQQFANGKYRLVYVAPERLRSTPFLEALRRQPINLLAVDEAHCISEWGHDFRPDYLHIAQWRNTISPHILTAALTATATPQVQKDILRLLGLEDSSSNCIVTGFNRPNLSLNVRYTSGLSAKLRALNKLLSPQQSGATIIYTGTRRDAEEVAEFAREVIHMPAEYYHAGLPAEERTRTQDAFISGKVNLVVATNAFGMGIDRADVRQVIHYSLPGSLEAYYQEAGRAGRDGLPANATLLYDPQDRALQEFFIQQSELETGDLSAIYKALPAGEVIWSTTDDLSRQTGLHPVHIKVGLSALEHADVLEHLGDEGIRMLYRRGDWNSRDIETIILHSKQHIQNRQKQLDAMVHYAESNNCRRNIILWYFGDRDFTKVADCCDNCQIQKTAPAAVGNLNAMNRAELAGLVILDCIRRLKTQVGREKLAQILRGSKAQDILKFHHDKNIYYGRLAVIRQADIEELIGQLVDLGFIKVIGGEYPILSLTPRGENAIQQKETIALKPPKSLEPANVQRTKSKLEAGGTVKFTAKLFADGLSPEQIAYERGLALVTIYGHLAQLISSGKLAVDQVVSGDVRQKIEKAILQVGSTQYLSPIKALLPDEIGFNLIRCVVAGRDLKVSDASQTSEMTKTEIESLILECVRAFPGKLPRSGVAKLLVGSFSERVAMYQTNPLYNRLQGHSRSEVMMVIDLMLEKGQLLKAEGNLVVPSGDDSAQHNRIPDNGIGASESQAIESFLTRSHPRPLIGSWQIGWSLGFHSRFSGGDWSRSDVGDLTYRLKYNGDTSVLPALVNQTLDLMQAQPELSKVDILLPVPSSIERKINPVLSFCEALAVKLNLPVRTLVAKTRPTQPQKEMKTLAQKRANVAGAFTLRGEVRNKRILLVDDLFDSGATVEEIVCLLLQHGAARVHVLTLTRTIHSDS